MEKKETGGPAYPHTVLGDLGQTCEVCEGMTLRDYFAAQALAGICAHSDSWGQTSISDVAGTAYEVADAMLKERSK